MKKYILLLLLSITCLLETSAQQFDHPALFESCNDPLISDAQQIDCSQQKLLEYISKKTEYPDTAVINEKQGLVLIRFTIDEKGQVTMVELLKGIDKACNDAALRAVRSLPAFSPAEKAGIPVVSELILPIRFKVKNLFHHKQEDLYKLHWAKVDEDSISRKEINTMLSEMPFVRDAKGINYRIEHLELTYIKGQKLETLTMEDQDNWSVEIIELFQKARRGGIYVMTARVSDKFQKIEVVREFYID
jgi:TonB family protein